MSEAEAIRLDDGREFEASFPTRPAAGGEVVLRGAQPAQRRAARRHLRTPSRRGARAGVD